MRDKSVFLMWIFVLLKYQDDFMTAILSSVVTFQFEAVLILRCPGGRKVEEEYN